MYNLSRKIMIKPTNSNLLKHKKRIIITEQHHCVRCWANRYSPKFAERIGTKMYIQSRMAEFHSYQMVQSCYAKQIIGSYHWRANNCSRRLYESSDPNISYSRHFRVCIGRLTKTLSLSWVFFFFKIRRLMKGSWLLRKAWKIYQSTYSQIYAKYAELFDNDIIKPRKFHWPFALIN